VPLPAGNRCIDRGHLPGPKSGAAGIGGLLTTGSGNPNLMSNLDTVHHRLLVPWVSRHQSKAEAEGGLKIVMSQDGDIIHAVSECPSSDTVWHPQLTLG
jgi:hypothetical protein